MAADLIVVDTIKISGRQPVTILHALDRINMGNAGQLEQAARTAYQKGQRNLVIDLTAVPSITSAGLRAILVIYKLLGSERANMTGSAAGSGSAIQPAKSAHLKILNASPEVLNVLHIAGFDSYLEFYTDQEEVIASY